MVKENLYYLFTSGIILGSGPCLALCAPLLISYTAAHKTTFKKSLISYSIFSFFKILSYILLGALCGLGVKILHSPFFSQYSNILRLGFGTFIILIGISTIFYKEKTGLCSWLHRGNIRNVGVLGFLVGLTPCLPLIGILNYIVIISSSVFESIMLSFVFGLGTVISPLLLLAALSAKFANSLGRKEKIKNILRISCGLVLLILGLGVTLQILLL